MGFHAGELLPAQFVGAGGDSGMDNQSVLRGTFDQKAKLRLDLDTLGSRTFCLQLS